MWMLFLKNQEDAEGNFFSNFKPVLFTEDGQSEETVKDLQSRSIRRHFFF